MHPALLLFVAGGLCLSGLDALGKWYLQAGDFLLLIWARYMGQLLLSLPLAWRYQGPTFWHTHHWRLQTFRSALLVLTSVLFFAGIRWLPLAEASAVSFTAPLWVAVLSAPLLGERVARSDQWVALLGFGAILLILRPGSEVFQPAALFLVAMAVTNAVFQLLTRKLTRDPPLTTFFYSGVVGAAGTSALLLWSGWPGQQSAAAIAALVGVGLLGGMGHLLFVQAFYRANVATLTPFVYLQMLWALLLGWLIFGQWPDRLALLGMALIAVCGLWLVLHRRRPTLG